MNNKSSLCFARLLDFFYRQFTPHSFENQTSCFQANPSKLCNLHNNYGTFLAIFEEAKMGGQV